MCFSSLLTFKNMRKCMPSIRKLATDAALHIAGDQKQDLGLTWGLCPQPPYFLFSPFR